MDNYYNGKIDRVSDFIIYLNIFGEFDNFDSINIIVVIIDLIFLNFVSDHGISGIMPFEVSIIRNNWTLRMRLRVVQLFLIMDTSSGIIPYIFALPNIFGIYIYYICTRYLAHRVIHKYNRLGRYHFFHTVIPF